MSGPNRLVASATPASKLEATSASRALVGSAPKRPSGAYIQSMIFLRLTRLPGTTPRAAAGIAAWRTPA